MKKLSLIIVALLMLAMTICANAVESSEQIELPETSSTVESEPVIDNSSVLEELEEQGSDVETSGPVVLGSVEPMLLNGNYDDKYHYDWDRWQKNYEYEVECWLGIKTNPLVEGQYGINPRRTEPWWDEWITEMLSERLIEQSWYDDMIAKGYIIEVD